MFKPCQAATETQQEFWIETRRLPQASAGTFCRKLDATLEAIGFTEAVRVIIGDPHETRRRKDKQPGIVKQVLSKAKRAVKSKSGKALLRKRGEHLERSFCHVLDHGKQRRATLRGRINLAKRHLAAAFTHNLSLLMRHLTGYDTIKQYQAGDRTGGCGLVGGNLAYLAAS